MPANDDASIAAALPPVEIAALRRKLMVTGYAPIPIVDRSKRPPMDGWQTRIETNDAEIELWGRVYPGAGGTGLLCKFMPALDIDILNPEAAEAVEALARERFEEQGRMLTRIGLAPKRALLFRAAVPFKKISASLIAPNADPAKPDGSQEQKLEFLGDGQQIVAFGLHVKTGKPYAWFGGEPGDVAREELPEISEAEAQTLIDDAVALLCREFGYKPAPGRKRKSAPGNGQDANAAGAGAEDWSYLTANILAGRELHDSLRDLAAKLVRSGTNGGAVVNHLRALMDTSDVPHDPRWRERRADIPRLVDSAAEKYREPPAGTDEAAAAPDEKSADTVEIARLARMKPLEYERERKAVAEKLGITRVAILDRLVQDERTRLGGDGDDGMQGRAISFPEPEAWPEPVDGAELLDEISQAIGRHVVMPATSCDACALWIAHTFLLDYTMISPRLAITSPTRGCGKTTALDVISQLVLRPLPAANVSASAIFRVVEGFHPTLLIDEADSFLKDNDELRGVLNSGHRKGGAVLRNVGDDHEPRAFSTYGACAIALIGQLPPTLTDRSVPIVLTRRKRDETITPFRLDRVDHLVVLARKLARWTTDNATAIAATEPTMPVGLYNRQADNWRPLLAIAQVAGGGWLSSAERAALKSVAAEIEDASWLELVLTDIRTIFVTRATDRLSSADLAEALAEIEGRPWGEFGRSEKPITPGKLARLLKSLAIVPDSVRIDEKRTLKGYYLNQFEEAFSRYLSHEGGFQNGTPEQSR